MNTGVCNRISFSSLPVFHLGFFLREMGERYRREMLAHGGAKEPMLMVEGRFNLFVTNTNRISCLPTNICKAPFCANSLRFPPRLWSCQSIGVLPHEFLKKFFFLKRVCLITAGCATKFVLTCWTAESVTPAWICCFSFLI